MKTALCVEAREGLLHAFLPPVAIAEDFVSLLAAPGGLLAGRLPARHHLES